jgi:hypothetical protein
MNASKGLAVWVLSLAACVMPACGGGGGGSSPTPVGAAPTPAPTPVPTPAAAFGPGQYLVNSKIPPGRYFADPNGTGCYWERESGLGGGVNDIIANDFVGYDARQLIVDILPSDLAFMGNATCGNWFTTPRQPAQSTIPPGQWLVGDQIAPGTYMATVGAGCYWERDRDFQGGIRSIITNNFIAAAGPALVSINPNDAGFTTDGDCGTWTRATSAAPPAATSERRGSEIVAAWRLYRHLGGLE